MRLCKVLPEDDEKQQSTINGGKVLLNERLWGRDCLTATSYFRFYLLNISSSVGFSGAKMSFYRS